MANLYHVIFLLPVVEGTLTTSKTSFEQTGVTEHRQQFHWQKAGMKEEEKAEKHFTFSILLYKIGVHFGKALTQRQWLENYSV